MNRDDTKAALRRILRRLAPEADLDRLPDDVPLREELDLDSVDFLHFVIALSKDIGVEVPEADYRRLATLQGCLDYLESHPAGDTPCPP
jgi:acyl carrier protein